MLVREVSYAGLVMQKGSLGCMVSHHQTPSWRTTVVIVGHKFTMCYYCYILQPDWSLLLLVHIQGSLYCKQDRL